MIVIFSAKTPEVRNKRATANNNKMDDETRSNSSATSNSKPRPRTPAQVKAESAARKAKVNKLTFGLLDWSLNILLIAGIKVARRRFQTVTVRGIHWIRRENKTGSTAGTGCVGNRGQRG